MALSNGTMHQAARFSFRNKSCFCTTDAAAGAAAVVFEGAMARTPAARRLIVCKLGIFMSSGWTVFGGAGLRTAFTRSCWRLEVSGCFYAVSGKLAVAGQNANWVDERVKVGDRCHRSPLKATVPGRAGIDAIRQVLESKRRGLAGAAIAEAVGFRGHLRLLSEFPGEMTLIAKSMAESNFTEAPL